MVNSNEIKSNTTGIPQALLSTDWQKTTRKRNIILNETVSRCASNHTTSVSTSASTTDKQDNTEDKQQVPLVDALTAPVIASTGEPLPSDAFEQLLLMLKFSSLDKPIITLSSVLPAFTPESLATLANELWDDYEDTSGRDKDSWFDSFDKNKRWFMTASAWLADKSIADKVWQFIKDYESMPTQRGSITHSFKVLATLASNYPDSERAEKSLQMLIKISQKARSTLRPHADKALSHYAKCLGLSTEQLADKLLPNFGLDKYGTLVVDYNPHQPDSRKITVSLTDDLTFAYHDETGKAFKNPPKAGKNDDENAVKEFLAQHKLDKKQLKELRINLPKRLEQMMIEQRALSLSDFMDYYVHHPVMAQLSKRLLWQVQLTDNNEVNDSHHSSDNDNNSAKSKDNTKSKNNAKDKSNKCQLFWLSESLELLDAEDNLLSEGILKNSLVANNDNKHDAKDAKKDTPQSVATPTVTITLVHPILLSKEQLATWSEQFNDYQIIQPFAQLARPVYSLSDKEKSTGEIHRFDNDTFATGSVIGLRSGTQNWEVIQYRGGYCGAYDKVINGHKLSITLQEGYPLYEGVPKPDNGQQIEPLLVPKDIDDITASEFLLAVDSMVRL
ncbi:DUF4132 domain-containing protein [Psychrobacter sp. I-STPA10]|uniref:DUF4132 domain-containing protein n=1 Tax=Psychrobacter sp. I-STPA10 TaxID=2585769 RepID=UPI001E4DDC1B|nr:DUF4132 domain-containing protein [Psychrobacter sp. I-STPA10]